MKAKTREVSLTKKEAVMLMKAVENCVHVYGAPEVNWEAKSLFSACKKFDEVFRLGVFSKEEDDE